MAGGFKPFEKQGKPVPGKPMKKGGNPFKGRESKAEERAEGHGKKSGRKGC
jgi:hypothetical protein